MKYQFVIGWMRSSNLQRCSDEGGEQGLGVEQRFEKAL